eukprot:CAMPEP_0116547946 /NCGR_PEP_ID=MMETSP0397-20121206/4055_1 /TAXON_ID=216820 /ORGANISM="Cyclophora tenuis, Strain ECT3854" /LENGTH=65 /DNA_ID=CAMNT_0004072525 /DNA_START=197 /DNA_END=391 /DNA_ORIENTATION=+
MTLFYEEYISRFRETHHRLLEFLELPQTGRVEEFKAGKRYTDYYSSMERLAILRLMKEYSSHETW